MRKIFHIFLMSIASSAMAQQDASNWVLLGSNSDVSMYIDTLSIKRNKEYTSVLIASVLSKPSITGTKRQDTLREYDCKNQTSKTKSMKTFDANGKHTDTIFYRLNWHSKINPNTPEHQVYQVVCR